MSHRFSSIQFWTFREQTKTAYSFVGNSSIQSELFSGGLRSVQSKTVKVKNKLAMENNNQQLVITTPNEMNGVKTSMQKKLSSLNSSNFECCIYKVPKFIRKENKECYRPSVISIGPVFYQNPNLQTMQQLKWIYLESFLEHPKTACRTLDSYINTITELSSEIRHCYQEPISYNDDEFIEMIVLDSVFLLCFFMTPNAKDPYSPLDHQPNNHHRPIPKELLVLKYFMDKDIFLLENQVPYFVLKCIFHVAFPKEPTSTLINLTRRFISGQDIPGAELVAVTHISDADATEIAHLVDFWRKCCCLSIDTQPRGKTPAQLPEMTAKQLSDAGVTFKRSEAKNPLNITFNKRNGELHIPKLLLKDSTEAVLRSILFYEQCYNANDHDLHSYFIDLFFFLDKLIDTSEDIQLLQQSGILNNLLGSDEAAVNLFNKITTYLSHSPNSYYYSAVSEELNTYANKSWNQWIAILRRDYFKHPWAIISFIFAILIFILTALKTIAVFTKNDYSQFIHGIALMRV